MEHHYPAAPDAEQSAAELRRLVDTLGAVIDGLWSLAFELRTVTRDAELAAAVEGVAEWFARGELVENADGTDLEPADPGPARNRLMERLRYEREQGRAEGAAAARHPVNGHRYCAACGRYL